MNCTRLGRSCHHLQFDSIQILFNENSVASWKAPSPIVMEDRLVRSRNDIWIIFILCNLKAPDLKQEASPIAIDCKLGRFTL